MKTHEILHILRNPYGVAHDEVRAASLEAADMIEAAAKIIQETEALCKEFVDKVETGRARSRETYAACKALLRSIEGFDSVG